MPRKKPSKQPSKQPTASAWFGIEFQGQVAGAFRECAGLGSESEVVEEKASGPKGETILRKIPGRLRWGDVTLRRGLTSDLAMWQWRQLVEEGQLDAARKHGSIVLFDAKGAELARWDLLNAWPSKLSSATAEAGGSAVAVEELTITHEGVRRVK
jgi:phage tail-like protein